MNDLLEVYESKRRRIISLAISIVIWIALIFLCAYSILRQQDFFDKCFYGLMLLLIAIQIFITCKNVVSLLRENRPLYVFYESGIEDWHSFLGLIEWSDITHLRCDNNRLHFKVTNLKKYLKRPFKSNHVNAYNKDGDSVDITIDFKKLTCIATDAFDFIQKHKDEFKLPSGMYISD